MLILGTLHRLATRCTVNGIPFRRCYSGLPDQSRVVVCGGGVIGCSVAYHLAKLGWTDVLVLEQGRYVLFLSDNCQALSKIAERRLS